MTTEDDFQAALDAHPDDHHTRLVLADWLQERGDVRADGYRALALNRFVLCDRCSSPTSVEYFPHQTSAIFCDGLSTPDEYTLPADWYARLRGGGRDDDARCTDYDTRRAAEDAAARAFAKLPAARRAELLAAQPPVRVPKPKPPAKKAAPKPKSRARKPKTRRRGEKS